jgi:hypothetical protein
VLREATAKTGKTALASVVRSASARSPSDQLGTASWHIRSTRKGISTARRTCPRAHRHKDGPRDGATGEPARAAAVRQALRTTIKPSYACGLNSFVAACLRRRGTRSIVLLIQKETRAREPSVVGLQGGPFPLAPAAGPELRA